MAEEKRYLSFLLAVCGIILIFLIICFAWVVDNFILLIFNSWNIYDSAQFALILGVCGSLLLVLLMIVLFQEGIS